MQHPAQNQVLESQVGYLKDILLSIPKVDIRNKQNMLKEVWKRFAYDSPTTTGDAFDSLVDELQTRANRQVQHAWDYSDVYPYLLNCRCVSASTLLSSRPGFLPYSLPFACGHLPSKAFPGGGQDVLALECSEK